MKIRVLDKNCIPFKKHESDAGWDLFATEYKTLVPGEEHLFDTGIQVAIPYGYCGLIVPRSSTGNAGANLKNTVGVIDSDYRGNLYVKIKNTGIDYLTIKQYDRFAQLLIIPVFLDKLEITDSLDDTNRGDGGFGSTGK